MSVLMTKTSLDIMFTSEEILFATTKENPVMKIGFLLNNDKRSQTFEIRSQKDENLSGFEAKGNNKYTEENQFNQKECFTVPNQNEVYLKVTTFYQENTGKTMKSYAISRINSKCGLDPKNLTEEHNTYYITEPTKESKSDISLSIMSVSLIFLGVALVSFGIGFVLHPHLKSFLCSRIIPIDSESDIGGQIQMQETRSKYNANA